MLSMSRLKFVPELLTRRLPSLSSVRSCSSKPTKPPELLEAAGKKAPKKRQVYIALLQPNNDVSYITLDDATKLAARRNLKLLKLTDFDKKREVPVYRILTAAQYREEELNLKKSKSKETKSPFKGEKLMAINATIGDHDLDSKVSKMLGWLDKMYEIRVTIAGSQDDNAAEKVYSKIEGLVSTRGRILQKRLTGKDIKFNLIPPKSPISKPPPPASESSS